MHYSTILENFNSFSPYLIQPDFPTVANKNLTKNSESLYFSRLLALSRLLHTQEVHGSSPCVSTKTPAHQCGSLLFHFSLILREFWKGKK